MTAADASSSRSPEGVAWQQVPADAPLAGAPVGAENLLAVAQREQPRAHSRLTWPDRAWLALLAGTVPAQRLAAMRLIVTPGTVERWHRDLVRRRWARLSRRVRSGRPATHRKVRAVVLRLVRENPVPGATAGSTANSPGSA